MLIAVLMFTETTVAKLAAHAITPEEVRQINDGDRIVIRNPRPRVAGSVLETSMMQVCRATTRSHRKS